jgi:shikimate dehydrogenase
LIGWPLAHSVSPQMHNAAFRALGLDWQYDAMAIPPDIVRLGLREPQQHGYIGLNVTVPHKEAVLRFVRPDPLAQAVGAVNTIDFRDNSGTNTDVAGLIDDLAAHDLDPAEKQVLVLGAGGAARAAVHGLGLRRARILVVNRTLERAQLMLADLSLHNLHLQADAVTLDEALERGFDLVINCTSAGMSPNTDETPWIDGLPYPRGVPLYDMVYRPARTRLMALADAAGGEAISGLGMLVRQGAASFKIWTGVAPPLDVMFAAAREALAGAQA